MEFGQLKVFVTVAAEQSFSRAAIKLFRTQPAVSQAIRRPEGDLGERLFDRSTKSATLTQAGDALLPEAVRKGHPFASGRELPMTILHSDRLVALASVQRRTAASTCATNDSAPPVVSSLTAPAGLVVIPLSEGRAASALTLVYRDNDGQPNAVEGFVEAVRSTGEDRASRNAPIAMRAAR